MHIFSAVFFSNIHKANKIIFFFLLNYGIKALLVICKHNAVFVLGQDKRIYPRPATLDSLLSEASRLQFYPWLRSKSEDGTDLVSVDICIIEHLHLRAFNELLNEPISHGTNERTAILKSKIQ